MTDKPSIIFLEYQKIIRRYLDEILNDKWHNLLNSPEKWINKMSSTIKIIIHLQVFHLASELP